MIGSRCASSADGSSLATEQQNAGHRNTTLTSLSQNAEEEETANLYSHDDDGCCWPGIDNVLLSYYQYELGKLWIHVREQRYRRCSGVNPFRKPMVVVGIRISVRVSNTEPRSRLMLYG